MVPQDEKDTSVSKLYSTPYRGRALLSAADMIMAYIMNSRLVGLAQGFLSESRCGFRDVTEQQTLSLCQNSIKKNTLSGIEISTCAWSTSKRFSIASQSLGCSGEVWLSAKAYQPSTSVFTRILYSMYAGRIGFLARSFFAERAQRAQRVS